MFFLLQFVKQESGSGEEWDHNPSKLMNFATNNHKKAVHDCPIFALLSAPCGSSSSPLRPAWGTGSKHSKSLGKNDFFLVEMMLWSAATSPDKDSPALRLCALLKVLGYRHLPTCTRYLEVCWMNQITYSMGSSFAWWLLLNWRDPE